MVVDNCAASSSLSLYASDYYIPGHASTDHRLATRVKYHPPFTTQRLFLLFSDQSFVYWRVAMQR